MLPARQEQQCEEVQEQAKMSAASAGSNGSSEQAVMSSRSNLNANPTSSKTTVSAPVHQLPGAAAAPAAQECVVEQAPVAAARGDVEQRLGTLQKSLRLLGVAVAKSRVQLWKTTLKPFVLKYGKVNPVMDYPGKQDVKLLLLNFSHVGEFVDTLKDAKKSGTVKRREVLLEQLERQQGVAPPSSTTPGDPEEPVGGASEAGQELQVGAQLCLFEDQKLVESSGRPSEQNASTLLPPASSVSTLHSVVYSVPYARLTAEEALRMVLPTDVTAPSSFETVGHLAHLNLRDEQLPWKFLIGKILLDKNPSLRSVYTKVGTLKNEFRTFEMELLAGEDDSHCLLKEDGLKLSLDFKKVYWNSRLSQERHVLLKNLIDLHAMKEATSTTTQTGPASAATTRTSASPEAAGSGKVRTAGSNTSSTCSKMNKVALLDLFAGIGGFALMAARKKIPVFANDLNPESTKWMEVNVEQNLVGANFQTNFAIANLDARDFVSTLFSTTTSSKGSGSGSRKASTADNDKRPESSERVEETRGASEDHPRGHEVRMVRSSTVGQGQQLHQASGTSKNNLSTSTSSGRDAGGSGSSASWRSVLDTVDTLFVVMNLPELALDFLDVFVGVLWESTGSASSCEGEEQEHAELIEQTKSNIKRVNINCHCFASKENYAEEIKQRVRKVLSAAPKESVDDFVDTKMQIREVRNIAPKKNMYCVVGDLPVEILRCRKKSQARLEQPTGSAEEDKRMNGLQKEEPASKRQRSS